LELEIGAEARRNAGGMTQYREVEGKKKVQEEVARFTSVDVDKMVEMVRVVAVRESWILEELSVVIDRMVDDGWSVGEVELVVKTQEEVDGARKKVQETADMLGFSPQKYGKVEHCLW
jgi:adenylate cyclase class IV